MSNWGCNFAAMGDPIEVPGLQRLKSKLRQRVAA